MDGEVSLIERLRNGDDLSSRIEAADEIERLQVEMAWVRGRLKEARDCISTWPGTSLAEGAIEILREIYRAK